MRRWRGAIATLAVLALAIALMQLVSPLRPDFPPFAMTIEEWNSSRVRYADGRTEEGTRVYRLDYRRRDDWSLTVVLDNGAALATPEGAGCRDGTYGHLDSNGSFAPASRDPGLCNGVGRWIHYGLASSYPWHREVADGRVTYTDPGERIVFDLVTGLPLLYEAGPEAGPVAYRMIYRLER